MSKVTSRFSEAELEENPRLRDLVRARHEDPDDTEYPLPHVRTSPDQFVANAIAADPALVKLVEERSAARAERKKRIARTMAPSVGKRGWPWVTPTAAEGRTKEEHAAAIDAEARDRQTAVCEAKAARLVEHEAKVKRARG
jgi:hypothetical protein